MGMHRLALVYMAGTEPRGTDKYHTPSHHTSICVPADGTCRINTARKDDMLGGGDAGETRVVHKQKCSSGGLMHRTACRERTTSSHVPITV